MDSSVRMKLFITGSVRMSDKQADRERRAMTVLQELPYFRVSSLSHSDLGFGFRIWLRVIHAFVLKGSVLGIVYSLDGFIGANEVIHYRQRADE